MDNKQILEALDDIVTFREEPTSEQIEALMEAMDIVEKYSKIGGWIPCSERLPDNGGMYLVTAVENGLYHTTFSKWQSRYKKWDLTGSKAYWKITAWQPLPEAYHGQMGVK